MTMPAEEGSILRSYLLGDVKPEIQARLEEQLMTDGAAFDELQRVEYDLIDAYIEGDLTEEERQRMETIFFASAARRQKLQFGRSLKQYISNQSAEETAGAEKRQRTAFWPLQSVAAKCLLAACFLLALGGAVFLTVRMIHLEDALAKALGDAHRISAEMRARNDVLSALLRNEQSQRRMLEQQALNADHIQAAGREYARVFSIDLLPGRLRDSKGERRIIIPPDTGLVRINVPAEAYPKYRASLHRSGDGIVWAQTSAGALSIQIPSELLPPAEYSLELSGIAPDGSAEKIGDFFFRIIRLSAKP